MGYVLTHKPYGQWPFTNLYPSLMATIQLKTFYVLLGIMGEGARLSVDG
jgi:hypothetical protein